MKTMQLIQYRSLVDLSNAFTNCFIISNLGAVYMRKTVPVLADEFRFCVYMGKNCLGKPGSRFFNAEILFCRYSFFSYQRNFIFSSVFLRPESIDHFTSDSFTLAKQKRSKSEAKAKQKRSKSEAKAKQKRTLRLRPNSIQSNIKRIYHQLGKCLLTR